MTQPNTVRKEVEKRMIKIPWTAAGILEFVMSERKRAFEEMIRLVRETSVYLDRGDQLTAAGMRCEIAAAIRARAEEEKS